MNLPTVEDLIEQADALIELKRATEALALLNDAARIEPENARLLCRFSRAHMELVDWQQALKYADEAVAADPDNEWGHRLRSFAQRHMGNYPESLRAALESVRISPEGTFSLHELARAQLACKYYDQAEATGWKLVEKDANFVGSYDLLAEVNIALLRWNRAEWCARKSLELDPLNTAALFSLASAVASQKNEQAALQYYVQILQTEPTNAEAQKKIMGIVGGFPLWAIPALIPIGWVALICLHVNGFAALGASLLGTFILVPILYRYFPKALLYPQPACWRLPTSYRVFVVRTWKDNWKTHSLNTMCITCIMVVVVVFVLVIAAGRFV